MVISKGAGIKRGSGQDQDDLKKLKALDDEN